MVSWRRIARCRARGEQEWVWDVEIGPPGAAPTAIATVVIAVRKLRVWIAAQRVAALPCPMPRGLSVLRAKPHAGPTRTIYWAQRHVDDRAVLSDIALAVTEAATKWFCTRIATARVPGTLTVEVQRDGDHLCVYVRDEGTRPDAARGQPEGSGLGLGLIAQVADSADVRAPETGGTEVVMRFNVDRAIASRRSSPAGLRPLLRSLGGSLRRSS